MKNIRAIILILSILISCQNDKMKDTYEINGTAKGIANNTVVTISTENNIVIDSTTIIGEKFQFKGKIEKPTIVLLKLNHYGLEVHRFLNLTKVSSM